MGSIEWVGGGGVGAPHREPTEQGLVGEGGSTPPLPCFKQNTPHGASARVKTPNFKSKFIAAW